MTHRVVIRIEAEGNITDAAVWYERQREGLGHDFLQAVDVAISAAAQNPFQFPRFRRNPEVRRVLTDRFPYRVFFIRRATDIVVFRVLHASQHDREWKSSVPDV